MKHFWALLFLFLLLQVPLLAKEKLGIAILDFSANNCEQSKANIVRNYLESALYNTNKFYMLEREHILKVYREKNINKIAIKDEARALSVGKLLKADFVIVGTLDKVDNYSLSVKVVYVPTDTILYLYAVDFPAMKDAKRTAKKLARKIATDMNFYIHYGSKPVLSKLPINFYVAAQYTFFYPIGFFETIVDHGHGFLVNFGINNLVFQNFYIGIETGYIWFITEGKKNGHCTFFPVLINIGIRYQPVNFFYMSPAISPGINYITFYDDSKEGGIVEPMFKTGLDFGFVAGKGFSIELGVHYEFIYETGGIISILSTNVGLIYNF